MNYQPKKLSQIYSKIRALDTLLLARVTSIQSSVNNISYTVTLLLTRQRKNLVNGTFSYLIPGTSWQMESTCGV